MIHKIISELQSEIFELRQRIQILESANGLEAPEVRRDYHPVTGEVIATKVVVDEVDA